MPRKHGKQFSSSRFDFGVEYDDIILEQLRQFFDARNVVGVEPDEVYNNYEDHKEIHQVIDYAGIDYLIDPFDSPVFGVNHRTHSETDLKLRFDIRKDTGSSSPSELDKLLSAEQFDFVPKYASRMKKSENGYEWFRVIDLRDFVDMIESGVGPDKTWSDGDVTAWMFDYGTLRAHNVILNRDDSGTTQSKLL